MMNWPKRQTAVCTIKITFVIQHRRTYQHSEQYTFANKRSIDCIQGYRTKYMNRYMSLFVFVRRFQEMDDNEKLPIILRRLKDLNFTITRKSLKTYNLLYI